MIFEEYGSFRVMTGMVCDCWDVPQTSDDVVKMSLSKFLMN